MIEARNKAAGVAQGSEELVAATREGLQDPSLQLTQICRTASSIDGKHTASKGVDM